MRKVFLVCSMVLACVFFFNTGMTEAAILVPLDQQINFGYTYNSQSPSGDAIYPAFNDDTMTFEATEGGFVRHHLETLPGGWWYQYVDLNLAGITTLGNGLDLSSSEATLSFETRFYQDGQTNTAPYNDAPVFLRIYTYDANGETYIGHRDYSIVYATQTPWSDSPYPTWTTVTVDLDGSYSDGGAFDITNVSRVRWYGTDWAGGGDDFVDFRNLTINATSPIPEPATMLLLGCGLVGLAALRRRFRRG